MHIGLIYSILDEESNRGLLGNGFGDWRRVAIVDLVVTLQGSFSTGA